MQGRAKSLAWKPRIDCSQRGTALADLCINTCKTIKADSSLHAGNPSRRLLDGARSSTFEKLGPCEGTLIAADGGDDIVVVVAVGDGNKVGVGKRHVCSKKDGISMQFSSEIKERSKGIDP